MNNSSETQPTSAPRWVKILGIVGLIVVVLVLVIIALGIGGEHGPGRHNPSGAIEHFVIASVAKQSPGSSWNLVAL